MPVGRSFLALCLIASLGFGAELRTLEGKAITGEVVKITDKEVVMRADGKEVSTPVEQILQIELSPAGKPSAAKYADVELTDGTVLHCSKVGFKGKEAELDTLAGPHVKLPMEAVSYWFSDAQDAKLRQAWKDALAKKRSSDLIGALKDGELATLPGTFGDADKDGKEINFDVSSQGKPRPVNLEKVHGMAFLRQPGGQPPVACKVLDTTGDAILASAVTVTDSGFTITTPAGVKIDFPRTLVARFDYTNEKLVYLSDMEPAKVVYSSTEDKPEPYRRDKNLDDTPGLRLGKTVYPKGLAIHSYTAIEYDLGGDYREFRAWIGVDELVGGTDGPTKVKIEGDGKELFSTTVSRKDPPPKEPTVLNIKDVRRLRIVVSSGDLLDLGRHVDLADAKVSK